MAVPEETEKKARDVNEKTALLKKKSATELGELATSINTIARDAHMEANLEMEIVPQGLRVLIKDDQNRNMFERGSAKIMPFFKTLLVELAPVFDSLDNKNYYYRAYRCDGLQKQYLQQLEPFGRSRAFGSSGAGRGRNAGR